MKPSITPLRYPGGKTWLIPYINKFLEFHSISPGTIIEPFAGSASVTIGLLSSNLMKTGIICEKDPLIIAFWNSALNHNAELCESVLNLDVTMDTWWDFKRYIAPESSLHYGTVDLATAFIFYNRTNYSGIINAGPIGGKSQKSSYKLSCRFNKERIIAKIKHLEAYSGRISVVSDDGIELIRRYQKRAEADDLFFYIDPPYYGAGKVLYRDYFRDTEHTELAKTVKTLNSPWLVSYDENEFIRQLYAGSESNYVYTDYQAGHLRRGVREMLFSNRKIPPLSEAPFLNLNSKEVISDSAII